MFFQVEDLDVAIERMRAAGVEFVESEPRDFGAGSYDGRTYDANRVAWTRPNTFHGLLAEIQERRNLAVLFITHDLRVAAQICDEVMVMQRGRVVEDGPAAEVLASPRHEYTRALINAAPGRDWDFATGRRIAGADA